MDEFSLISRYFRRSGSSAALGIGDDCGIVSVSPGTQLAVTTDTLVSGVHFFENTDAELIGWKSLAVNVSDLAAMGAAPRYFTLALTLPSPSESFLEAFSRGMFALADQCGIEILGGDTTSGPLSITITAMGELPRGKGILRSKAAAGDDIWVSGDLGGAAHAVGLIRRGLEPPADCLEKLHRPQPRVALGLLLTDTANSMLDVSDGLLAASGKGAQLELDAIPLTGSLGRLDRNEALLCALTGGDDYELCFSAPRKKREQVKKIADLAQTPVSRIGTITGEPGIEANLNGQSYRLPARRGYNHFEEAWSLRPGTQ